MLKHKAVYVLVALMFAATAVYAQVKPQLGGTGASNSICIATDSGRLYSDDNCGGSKGVGEEYLDHAGGGGAYTSIKITLNGNSFDVDNENIGELVDAWKTTANFDIGPASTFTTSVVAGKVTGITYSGGSTQVVCFDANVLLRMTDSSTNKKRHTFLTWLTSNADCSVTGSNRATTPDSRIGEVSFIYHRHFGSDNTQGDFFGGNNSRICVDLPTGTTVGLCIVELQSGDTSNTALLREMGTSLQATLME